jgi:hypothetical protein
VGALFLVDGLPGVGIVGLLSSGGPKTGAPAAASSPLAPRPWPIASLDVWIGPTGVGVRGTL